MKRALAGLLLCGFVFPAYADVWADSVEPNTRARFIPLELWAGTEWNGDRSITPRPASTMFGARGEMTIDGPREWVHPRTGKRLMVYDRRRSGRSSNKHQLFALRDDGAGLGRVYEGRGDYTLEGEVKFPLGEWREGESRAFDIYTWRDGGDKIRRSVVTIVNLDHAYRGTDHCLTYRWQLLTERDTPTDDKTYIYCPGQGMVEPEN
jgi:hypothetical protein